MLRLVKSTAKSIGTRLGLLDRPSAATGAECGADWYDQAYRDVADYHAFYTRSRYYFLWTVIVDRVRRSGHRRILEIGCGPGQLAAFLMDQGVEQYVGLDFSPTAIAMARTNAPRGRFEVGDARAPEVYAAAEHDAIICTEVLEHIDDDLQVVSMFPAGTRCLCSVPNFPYESHVRHFEGAGAVVARYARYFHDLDVMTFKSPRSPEEEYYLFDGVRNAPSA